MRTPVPQSDVPFFFKQWGGRTPRARGRELGGRVYDGMPLRAAVG
jgi:protein gp37